MIGALLHGVRHHAIGGQSHAAVAGGLASALPSAPASSTSELKADHPWRDSGHLVLAHVPHLASALLIPATLLAVSWQARSGLHSGILKARFGVNEILSTVMLNVVAAQILIAMLHGPLIDPAGVTAGTYLPQSEQLPEQCGCPGWCRRR